MSLGRKTEVKETKIKTPPPITSTTYTNPLGDQFTSSTSNGVETHGSNLSPGTQSLVNTSVSSLQSLAQELNSPDAQRVQQISNHAQDYYDLQAEGINQDSDDTLARTKSDLNKRFGGAYNATFGTSLLAGIENNRLGQLSDARKDAVTVGENLQQQDENSRIQRFNLFQNYLNDLNNEARGLQNTNTTVFSNQQQQATDLATQQANLALKYAALNQQAQMRQSQQDRQAATQVAMQVAQIYA